jgi:outer membrane receptor protein involved in Fe transport
VITPRVALSVNAWPGNTIKVSYSTAFRAPSRDESDNVTARRIRADGLEPEQVKSVELSAHQQVGAHRVVVGGFYSHWDKLVELAALSDQEAIAAIRNGETSVPFTPGIQLTQYRNASDITNYGMNTGIEGSFHSARILYGFTLTCAVAKRHTDTGTGRLPVAPQLFGNARLAYVLADPLPTVALAARVLGPRPADLSNGQFTPDPHAPAQVELRLTLSGNVTPVAGLSYRVIANYAVADRGPYVVGPVTAAIPTQTAPQLNPVDQFRTTVGLQYEF